ncbi:RagB/SusD family nutrient uptake outer membrane protein [Mangrovibacterium lignilyticum]|uniref:RagB/SusD family nutrient uptake outer membrane protein n=1 Tax=Mangrovibacterium lignilyticum TaxID=2668052 RepID=UPI0013D0DC4F|nr:RagB/SusD family nutrient uptake outer membrane protein [Mangrovibacterium lignilyticum]
MKTKIFFQLSLGLLLLLFINACNDEDFLTEEPETFYTTENSYNTASQVDASVTNMYVHIRYWFQNNYFMKGQGTDLLDTPYWRCSGNGYSNFSSWSSEYGSVRDVWNAFYQLVSYANQTLEGAESSNFTWDNLDDYNYVIAQSKFFRGFAYMTLAELYGGVPLVDEFYTTPKYDFVRSSREETYHFAINDLLAALDGMPDYPSEAGRVAKGATCHYLSEAYLGLANELDDNTAYLDSSIYYASEAINLHSLMTSRFGSRSNPNGGAAMNGVEAYYEDGDVFFDLFQRGNLDYEEGNTEALWTLENDYDVYLAYGGNNYLAYPREFSPVLRNAFWDADHKEQNASPWLSLIDAYVGGRGVSSIRPTEYVVNDVWQGDFAEDIRNSGTNIRREFMCMDPTSSYYGDTVSLDMLDQTTLERLYPIWTKLAPVDDWGYEDLSDGGNRSNMYRDEYACRLAETYLLRAEAYFRKGSSDLAAADINVLRARAQCTYMATSADISIDFILDERTRELFSEERRWCTLLRMGDNVAIERISKYSYYAGSESSYFQGTSAVPGGWSLFPIPQSTIDANLDVELEQNTGW